MMTTAAIPLWPQSRNQPGGKKMAHPVVHFEIGCKDIAKTGKFFGELFGWNIGPGPAPAIDTGGAGDLSGHITALGHEPQHYTIFYVEVDDVQAALDKAVSLGGKMVVPPIKIPTRTFAWFSDPEGNTIGLLKRS
jgi:predicted enzyme related to lactoylglutathione lyase